MNERDDKHRKRYADHLKDRSKLVCPINGARNSSDECKVLGDFGSKYYKSRPTKDRGQETAKMKKLT